MIETHLFSSLIKVFPDEKPVASELKYGSMLGGETYSFQIAYSNPDRIPAPIKVEAEGDLAQFTLFRRVGFFPVENMGECLREGAEKLGFERRKPGLYPDILYPDMEWTHCCAGNWYSIWAEIRLPKDYPAGEYDLKLKLKYRFDIKSNDFLDSESMTLKMKVIPANLPKQTLTHTEWFYCDCLANYYHLEPWSEPFWKVLENYFTNFAAHGINLLLTPIFTVALDTAQDKERLTTQLIGVQKSGDQYTFDFSLLKRWIDLAQKCGIEQFEFSHLFKQGGGKYPVKVVAEEDGVLKKIFDWNMSAQDPAYQNFIDQFLPQLVAHVREWGIENKVYFHITDEPNDEVLANYTYDSELVKRHIKGFRILDALSHVEFVENGLLDMPVPIEMSLEKFLKYPLKERWTYYCGGPDLPYSNRLHTMPASANRIMGVLLYWYQCTGFLHWGYNFWNSGSSLRATNPLGVEPDFDYHPGDQFLVYPGPDGAPWDSMRFEVFTEGLQDFRALQLLESLSSRETVIQLITETAGYELSMNRFPIVPEFLPELRNKVNSRIAELVSGNK